MAISFSLFSSSVKSAENVLKHSTVKILRSTEAVIQWVKKEFEQDVLVKWKIWVGCD